MNNLVPFKRANSFYERFRLGFQNLFIKVFFNFSKLFKFSFSIKKSHTCKHYRNVCYRNGRYDAAKLRIKSPFVQIIQSFRSRFLLIPDGKEPLREIQAPSEIVLLGA